MKILFDFGQQRTFGRAALFYVGHFLIAVVSAGLAGTVAGAHAYGASAHSVASSAGQLVALIYSGAICVSVIVQRNLSYKYYVLLVLVLPAAVMFGALGGLVIPTFLTTRPGARDGAPLTGREIASRTFAARATEGPIGRRSPITR
jgi:hypothetical protein